MARVRLAELAKIADVSLATVSRVLNQSGYVAEDVRSRVERAVQETGYVHPAHKRPLCTSKLIGLVTMNGIFNPYFERMTQSLSEKAEQQGYYCIQVSSAEIDNDALALHAERLISLGVCGIVVCSFDEEHLGDNARTALGRSDVPVVFLERSGGCYGFNRVLIDNELGVYSATRHLIEQGHKNLLYISWYRLSAVERSRVKGFTRAIAEASEGSIAYQVQTCTSPTHSAAMQAMQTAFEKDSKITGVVTWNDIFAVGALHHLNKIGLNVPSDVELIGHDNVLAPTLNPPLSSVEMPIDEIAVAAIEIIDKSQNQKTPPFPRTITLEPRLVIR